MATARTTIHDFLAAARADLVRLAPHEASSAMRAGAVLVDTRTDDQRREEGVIPGAIPVRLSELEWRIDPDSGHSDLGVGLADWIVIVCAEGYASSLAAARLKALGFARATDLDGGFAAWKAAGLPIASAPT